MLSALLGTTQMSPYAVADVAPVESLSDAAAGLRPVVRAVVACVLKERADHADVEDATNETLRRALEAEKSARGPLRPWVLGIARHVALDVIRTRQKQRTREEQPVAASSSASVIDHLADPGASADVQIELAERAARVRRVLSTLPAGPRNALELFHLGGMPYQEIAKRLDVPLGTVATWVTRGRKAMAEALEDELPKRRGTS